MTETGARRLAVGLTVAFLVAVAAGSRLTHAAPAAVTPASLPRLGTVDSRYQSYNVEMVEVVGGRFWKPYAARGTAIRTPAPPARAGTQPAGMDPGLYEARPPIDLSNPRLRTLAAALGPAYVRVSGTWANTIYFHDSDDPAPAAAPAGFQNVLTRRQWAGVVSFARAVNAKLVSSFAISPGVRDAAGVWTPGQARKVLAYTRAIGGDIAAAELFNEPSFPLMGGAPPGYDAAAFARDVAAFRSFARTAAPDMLIVGPGSVGEGVSLGGAQMERAMLRTPDLLAAAPQPVFDIFSYHFYGAVSERCASLGGGALGTTPAAALTDEWLSRTDAVYAFYAGLRDRYDPGKPIWLTETADAACGGNPWAPTFLDTFRYLDQLGRLAVRGVAVVFHNTLAASEYGMIDLRTLTPRPKYWAALLWRRLMGPTVLDAGGSRPGLHLYAQCLPGHAGGVTLVAINTSRDAAGSIEISVAADRYTLTARSLDEVRVQLNGRDLTMRPNGTLPVLAGVRIPSGPVALAPASITFLAMAQAGNASCP